MTFRKLAPFLSLSVLTVGLLLAAPRTAQAAEVMCSNAFGECTVSNDGQSFISCSCEEGGSDGGSGGDEFNGLSEEELQAICIEQLAWCEPQGDGDGDAETGTTTGDPTDGGEGTSESGEEGTSDSGEEGTSESGEEGTTESGDGDGDSGTTDSGEGEGESSTSGEGEEGSTGDPGEAGDTDEGSTGDPGEGEGEAGDGDGDSGDSGDGSGSDDGSNQSGSGDGGSETGTGGDSAGAEGQAEGSGCAVTPNASGFGLLMLSMLGLLGLRRRENA
jgi:MYXO-CTERM domain-containing protein